MKNRDDHAAPEDTERRSRQHSGENDRCKIQDQSVDHKIKKSDGQNDQWDWEKDENRFHNPVEQTQYDGETDKRPETAVKIKIRQQNVGSFEGSHCDQNAKDESKHASFSGL